MKELARAVGALSFDVTLLLIILWWVFALATPVFCWVLVRNVVKGRRALERIAARLEGAAPNGGSGVLGL